MQTKEYSLDVAGKKLTAHFSNLTDQTNGSVMVKTGETVVLATAVMGSRERTDLDYFPLTVDYEEKFYAAGLVLGGRYMKREGRPSDEAILAGRAIDRTIRPLFDHSLRREIQVTVTVLSIDEKNDPDVLSIFAASLALAVSDIPWNGPVGAVRVGLDEEGTLLTNPIYGEREQSPLDLLICGKDRAINMIEAGAKEVSEEIIGKGFEEAVKVVQTLEDFQKKIVGEIGKEKISFEENGIPKEVVELFESEYGKEKLTKELFSENTKSAISTVQTFMRDKTEEVLADEVDTMRNYIDELVDEIVHEEGLKNDRRVDGRKMNEVRGLYTQAGGISENLHGVGIFFRGGTHIMSVLTLAGPQDSQIIEGMEVRTKKHFMHHYNFPPYSVGETGRMGGINRRSTGHGALAEKALKAIIPPQEKFPYTIRLVSETMASNGSSSMGSVCASSLALADGGVPIKAHIAGIAMGLIMSGTDYKILTDIQGPEDHHGDMDLKVAGTRNGVCALQMDVKVDGISPAILKEALVDAKKAREHILTQIETSLPSPRKSLKDSAPHIVSVPLDPERVGAVIGSGGKTIKKLSEDTGTEINIEDDNVAYITGHKDKVAEAVRLVELLGQPLKIGEKFEGTVVKVFEFGVLVEVGPGVDGLVHVSEIANFRVEKVEDVLKIGQKVPVLLKEIDDKGRNKFSIKGADPNFIKKPESQK